MNEIMNPKPISETRASVHHRVPVEIQSEQHFQDMLSRYRVVVVDIYANWCQPCKALAPKYALIAEEYSNPNTVFLKENTEQVEIHHVNGLPSLVFYVNGNKVKDVLGGDISEIVNTLNDIYSKLGLQKAMRSGNDGISTNTDRPMVDPYQDRHNNHLTKDIRQTQSILNKPKAGSTNTASGYARYCELTGSSRDQGSVGGDRQDHYIPQSSSIRQVRK